MREKNLSVLIVGDSHEWRERAERLRLALTRAQFIVLDCVAEDADLDATIRRHAPDAILIHTDSPARDTLEHLALVNRRCPRPMVMLCEQGDRGLTREAAQAGVSLYVIDEVSPGIVESLLNVALVQFQGNALLQRELARARQSQDDREAIGGAKCLLMEQEHLSESEAYARLRRLAMSRRQPLPQLSRALLSAARRSVETAGA